MMDYGLNPTGVLEQRLPSLALAIDNVVLVFEEATARQIYRKCCQ